MDHGVEVLDAVLLFETGVALLATIVVSRRRRRAVLSVLVGAGILLLCASYLDAWTIWNSRAASQGPGDFFPPEPTDGFLLTVLGGLLILLGGVADASVLGFRRLRKRFAAG